jgi:predicted kinase
LIVLVAFGGLPGVGKTTIARALARQLGAVHLRIDTIEYAIRESGVLNGTVDAAGYETAYAVAEDNLRLGLTVIGDSVNPLPITRSAWRDVARRAGVPIVEVEVTCSDKAEHRRRVETRGTDFPGWTLTWQEVVDRDYRPWDRERVVIDTATAGVDEGVRAVRAAVEKARR